MKKVMIVICCLIVFIGAVCVGFLFTKNNYNIDNKNEIVENKQENEEKSEISELIVETNRFATDWEWNSSILADFPNDARYHIKKDIDVNLMYNVIDNEDVYKEYADRMNNTLPQEVNFNENFVILLTTEEYKTGPEEDLEIADITHNEDGGTMNIILKPRSNPREFAYLNYNAWYAIVNDRSLLRDSVKIIIEE